MANVAVLNMAGAQVGTIELNDAIFGIEANEHVMHLAVVQYLANQRQGTQSTKTRAEVRGGGRKPYRQKGTGRARQGSIRSPQWVGGGVVFAPKPRDYSFKLNKKVKRLALQSALSTKVAEGKIIVLDELTLSEVKTKEMVKVLGNIKCDNALIVMDGSNENVMLSARNIPTVNQCLRPAEIQQSGCNKRSSRKNPGGVRIMADLKFYDVIERPVITENSMSVLDEKKYTFIVHPEATKAQIKDAVEKMFEGAKVASVNTMNYDGKPKRRGMFFGKTKKYKKAVVKLTADSKDIEIFMGM